MPASDEIAGIRNFSRGTDGRSLRARALNCALMACAAFFARCTRFMKNSLIIVVTKRHRQELNRADAFGSMNVMSDEMLLSMSHNHFTKPFEDMSKPTPDKYSADELKRQVMVKAGNCSDPSQKRERVAWILLGSCRIFYGPAR